MSQRDLLSEVFSTPEYAVKDFMDTIRETAITPSGIRGLEDAEAQKELDVRVDAVETEQISGLIRIVRVWHKDDHAWHIAPMHPKRPWKVSEDRVIFSIIKVMAMTIPQTVRVDYGLPYHDPDGKWDIKEITFKARGIKNVWNVTQRDLDRMTEKLFEVLNRLV